jgi:hypothetical protein
MIYAIGVVAIGLAWALAIRPAIPKWLPMLVPVALALYGYALWDSQVEQGNRNLALAIMGAIEILTLSAAIAGLAYRRNRTRREHGAAN